VIASVTGRVGVMNICQTLPAFQRCYFVFVRRNFCEQYCWHLTLPPQVYRGWWCTSP